MVYTLAPYAMKSGFALAKYGPAAAKAFGYGKLAKSAYNGYQNYNRSVAPYRKKQTAKAVKRANFRSVQEFGQEGHTVTKSNVKIKKKLTKQAKILKETIPSLRRYTSELTAASTQGRQNWTEASSLWTYSQLGTYAGENDSAQMRTYIEGGSIKLILVNYTSTPVFIRIHDWVAKKDIFNGTPAEAIASSLEDKYINTPDEYKYPWMNASESVQFNNQYKVKGMKDIILQPGENHVHDYYFTVNKYWINNTYTHTTPKPIYVAGITHGILVRTLGSIVKQSDANTNTYATTKVGLMMHHVQRWKTPSAISGQVMYAEQGAVPTAALATEEYLNEETGAPVLNTQA